MVGSSADRGVDATSSIFNPDLIAKSNALLKAEFTVSNNTFLNFPRGDKPKSIAVIPSERLVQLLMVAGGVNGYNISDVNTGMESVVLTQIRETWLKLINQDDNIIDSRMRANRLFTVGRDRQIREMGMIVQTEGVKKLFGVFLPQQIEDYELLKSDFNLRAKETIFGWFPEAEWSKGASLDVIRSKQDLSALLAADVERKCLNGRALPKVQAAQLYAVYDGDRGDQEIISLWLNK